MIINDNITIIRATNPFPELDYLNVNPKIKVEFIAEQ